MYQNQRTKSFTTKPDKVNSSSIFTSRKHTLWFVINSTVYIISTDLFQFFVNCKVVWLSCNSCTCSCNTQTALIWTPSKKMLCKNNSERNSSYTFKKSLLTVVCSGDKWFIYQLILCTFYNIFKQSKTIWSKARPFTS